MKKAIGLLETRGFTGLALAKQIPRCVSLDAAERRVPDEVDPEQVENGQEIRLLGVEQGNRLAPAATSL